MLQRKQDWNSSIDELRPSYVPLQHVSVEATIRSFAANVTITQVFRNCEAVPIEAVYCFPIEEQAAVYAFVARIDDREVVAELKEKKQAQREYNTALQEHHGAFLLEQDEASQDNFVINVGALPPNKECYITISYVSELDLVQDGTKIRFVVPTTIAPRYNPNVGGIGSPASTTAQYVQSAPYTIKFHCRVEKNGISRVSSISHPIQIDFNQEDVYVIEFAKENTHLDRDIIMDFELAENRLNTIIAIEPGAIMASFTPTEQDYRRILNEGSTTNDFIFIIDCSGSMGDENKIDLARQAMLLFLKSLPIDCHFNIIRFGSNYKSLFSNITAIYNEENAQKAEQLTKDMSADLGGTELLLPLKWLKENPPIQGHSRQIFLLSDGEISNVDDVLDLCRSMAVSTRIFSFGLGHASSRALIKGLARATNGRFVFIPPGTYVDIYVGEQLQKALQPCITNVRIKLNLDSTLVDIVPRRSPPVFINDRLIVYAVLNNDKSTSFDHDVSVELYSEKHCLCNAKVNRIPSVSDDGMIARLAAKALILELQHAKLPSSAKKNLIGLQQTQSQEHNQQETETSNEDSKMTKEQLREEIIQISLKHNILSPYTAFVGIEKRVNGNNADLVLREVPIEISTDNQYLKYLEEAISQMQVDYQQHEQIYDSAMSGRHHYDHELDEIFRMLDDDFRRHKHVRKHIAGVCQGYDNARAELASVLTEYDEARQRVDSTNTNENEARQRFDNIRDHYNQVRNHLNHTRSNYDTARQQLNRDRVEYADTRKRIDHIFNHSEVTRYYNDNNSCYYDRTRQDLDDALSSCRDAQQHFDHILTDYDNAHELYADVVQSIDQSYQAKEEGQPLLQQHKKELNSTETLFQRAHESLKDFQDNDRSHEIYLYEAYASLRDYACNLECIRQQRYESSMESQHHMKKVSAEIHYAENLLRQQQAKQSKSKLQKVIRNDDQGNLDIVRRIIAQQKFDGLWNVDVEIIKQLTGKSLSEFQQLENTELLISAIIIMALETRFASLLPMWYGVVQKTRKRLLDMLDKDDTKLNTLLESIRKQL